MVQLVLIHGVGGVRPAHEWLQPLNDNLDAMNSPRIGSSDDVIVVPAYKVEMNADIKEAPRETHSTLPEQLTFELKQAFELRQQELGRVVRPAFQRAWSTFMPFEVIDPLAEPAEWATFPDVKAFVDSERVRWSVWNQVLAKLRPHEPTIVIAHSLGTIVTVSLLRRLPANINIDLLITIGSPLAFSRYRNTCGPVLKDFPYARVQRWLNVYSPMDPVTGLRGLAGSIPQALDVSAPSRSHALDMYMSQPGVAKAISHVAFGSQGAPPADPAATVAQRLHPSWNTLLLGTAFSQQVWKVVPESEWRARGRLSLARRETARRVVDDIAERRRVRVEQLRVAREAGWEVTPEQVNDHPLADGRFPSLRDLETDGAARLAETWPDAELLSLAMALMMQPVVAPFDIKVGLERREAALVRTLNLVRERGKYDNLSDQDFAAAVRSGIRWAQDQVKDDNFPWGAVLIGSGLALLAATGVGLAVAAPAGLAGAAVVTSTLAAFGPGGMVGGLVTLGALTGTASSLTAVGVGNQLQGDQQSAAAAIARDAAELAVLPADVLTVTLVGMLAVLHAQEKLGFDSTVETVRAALSSALDAARTERRAHQQVAPDADGTKTWARKVTLLERAFNALDRFNPRALTEGVRAVRSLETPKAITGG